MSHTLPKSTKPWGVVRVSRSLDTRLDKEMRENADRQWTVTFDNRVTIRVTIREVHHSPQIVGLAFEPADQSESVPTVITADLIRRVPLRQIKQACLADNLEERGKGFIGTFHQRQGTGRAPLTNEFLKRVAEVYRDAGRQAISRQKLIMETFEVEPKTADKYVRRARDAGLLEEVNNRKGQQ